MEEKELNDKIKEIEIDTIETKHSIIIIKLKFPNIFIDKNLKETFGYNLYSLFINTVPSFEYKKGILKLKIDNENIYIQKGSVLYFPDWERIYNELKRSFHILKECMYKHKIVTYNF